MSIRSGENSLLNNLSTAMELMPPNIAGIERRIWASVCIVAYQAEVTPEYVISKDSFVGLLGINDEFESFRCSPVMQLWCFFLT